MMVEVVRCAGLATVQDGGRPGRMHEGVPPGGALVPRLLARANAAARNRVEEAALEVCGSLTIAARGGLRVASDDGSAVDLRDGETYAISSGPKRVRYLAVRGGIDVPAVLGGKGTLLVARFGGCEGRPLRRGDTLRAGLAPEQPDQSLPVPDWGAPVHVVPGPDNDRFAAAALLTLTSGAFKVSPHSDRVGIRLVGPELVRLDGDTGVSAPMVIGAIQVPASGEPIVLGPDHPTTGGYPVLATVVRSDLSILTGQSVGAWVRFALAR